MALNATVLAIASGCTTVKEITPGRFEVWVPLRLQTYDQLKAEARLAVQIDFCSTAYELRVEPLRQTDITSIFEVTCITQEQIDAEEKLVQEERERQATEREKRQEQERKEQLAQIPIALAECNGRNSGACLSKARQIKEVFAYDKALQMALSRILHRDPRRSRN